MTYKTQHLSVSVECDLDTVYRFISDPTHLPEWALGLSQGEVSQVGEKWIADSPMGKVSFQFVEANPFGVLDHNVTLESGETFYNPLRVMRNGTGAEVVFTLFQLGSEDAFISDAEMVKEDLQRLKRLLEK